MQSPTHPVLLMCYHTKDCCTFTLFSHTTSLQARSAEDGDLR